MKLKNKRVPLGSRNKLKYPARPGFYRRVVNDIDDRIQQFKDAGYEPVVGDMLGGEVGVNDPKKLGAIVSKPVGNKITGVLMEIPLEFYEEDQKAKQEKLAFAEREMIEKRPEGITGTISVGQ
jgi:hypothetical protein